VESCELLLTTLKFAKTMATAGYSGTPLLKKLGIKPETKVLQINAPVDYFKWLENDISQQLVSPKQIPDLVHFFAGDFSTFEKGMKKILPITKKNSAVVIWVSWYKKSSALFVDLTEDMIRNFALQNDLVDVKVCAVSDAWSGLKLVVPVSKR
jgi:hypothetical protein